MKLAPTLLAGLVLALDAGAQTTVAGSTPGSFRVTETGAAEYRIPIQVPRGVAGMEPKLALVYNSQGGNGLLGVGWNLEGLSAITRCPRTTAQDGVRGGMSYDWNDRYCLDGHRLMVVSVAYGADGAEYRTEREGFTKVISYGTCGGGPCWFKAWTKSGQIIEYGNTADSRMEVIQQSTVRLWAANRIADTKGNAFTVTYVEDSVNGEQYPSRIDYGNGQSVRFEVVPRGDVIAPFSPGPPTKQTVRLERIRTYVGANQVKEYRLAFGTGPGSGRSRLQSLTECNDVSVCLAPLQLSWYDGGGGSPVGFGNLVQTYASQSGWKSQFNIYVGDFDGDGVSDLYLVSDGDLHFCKGGFSGGLISSAACTRTYSGSSSWKSQFNIYTGDFDGDGITDLYLVSDANLHFCKGGPNGGLITSAACTQTFGGTSGWTSQFNIYPGDFDGDGIADLYLVGDANLHFCKGGAGLMSASCPATYVGSSQWKSQFNIYPGDYDGDGITDLYLVGDANLYFCKGGPSGGLLIANCPATFVGTSSWKSQFNIHVGDFNGDGTADMYLVGDGPLHFFGGGNGRPDLLTNLTTGLSAATSITYKALTDASVYTKGSGAAYPSFDVAAPVYVAFSASHSDGITSAQLVNYTYGAFRAAMDSRGFLGFQWMEGTQQSTGLKTCSEFRQDWPYVGLPSLVKKTQSSGVVLSEVSNTFSCTNPASGSACTVAAGNRYFPYVSQSAESGNDLNGAALPTITTTNQYDTYGNATSVVVSTGDGFSKTTSNTFTNDTINWLLSRLTRSTVQSTAP